MYSLLLYAICKYIYSSIRNECKSSKFQTPLSPYNVKSSIAQWVMKQRYTYTFRSSLPLLKPSVAMV